ncbi:MAG: biotin/lipoyl-containing protein [Rikenellaceae bacterium]
MSRKLKIRDLTLRDGQQSSFATRMTQEQIDRVLSFYKDAGFYAMEVWGGAVPDSVMRYLGENPWHRLEKIKAGVGDVSLLTALSRGRNLFGYAPYTDEIIDGFSRNAVESGLGIMRIFDALNDVDNVKSTIKYVKKYGGIADCAICYTIDPKEEAPAAKKGGFLGLFGKKAAAPAPQKPIFTDEYFVDKARQMVELGADMITIKDMSGLIPPQRVYDLIKRLKQDLNNVTVDFHTHCTPGYGLASVVSAIAAGVDIVDTNIWNFSGGPAAPSIEFIYLFCKKMGVEMDVNMEAVAKINHELFYIRKELAEVDAVKMFPKPFDPTGEISAELDALIDRAAKAAEACNEAELMDACRKIEDMYGFPAPNELVKKAEIPGGMYTNMVAQLKALKSEEILEAAMKLIPQVRKDAGLIPLVTPTSQIVGAQAVNCALDLKNGRAMYTTCSNQFVSLVKGEYGKTPIAIDPMFRKKITGSEIETPYDTSNYKMQDNPVLPATGKPLAETEKEVLLLELFPQVARGYLTKIKEQGAVVNEVKAVEVLPVVGNVITAPMPGKVFELCVKVGDEVSAGQDVMILEAMKMENNIATMFGGKVRQIFVKEGETVAADGRLLEIE